MNQHQKDLQRVMLDGYALEFVNNQTEEICLAAVEEDGGSLRYVKRQTEEICLAAVKQSIKALKLVKEQTPEICLVVARGAVDLFTSIESPAAFVHYLERNNLTALELLRDNQEYRQWLKKHLDIYKKIESDLFCIFKEKQ